MNRIAVAGSHGVGKSYLVERLSEYLILPRIKEVARTVAEGWFKDSESIKNASMDKKILFQLNVFYRQLWEEEHRIEFISDRSIFDVVAYSIYYQLPKKIIDMLLETAVNNSERYDLIIYCPIPEDAELVDDGFRFIDRDSQVKVDRILQELLENAKCEVLKLGKWRESWLSEVVTFINCRRKGIPVNAC